MRVFILSIVFITALSNASFGQVSESVSDDPVTIKKDIKKLIIYGSDTCHYCIDTKTFLKERKIDFIYYDVDVNLEKQNEMVIKLQKAGIPLDAISLPIVDLQGKLIMNNVADFNGFLKKLIQKTK